MDQSSESFEHGEGRHNKTVQPPATAPVSCLAVGSHSTVVAVASAAASGCG
jgi:hypothetical protein